MQTKETTCLIVLIIIAYGIFRAYKHGQIKATATTQ